MLFLGLGTGLGFALVVGRAHAKKLQKFPKGVRLGSNTNAFIGGYRLWRRDA
jgi:hypothetical protein